MEKDEMKMAYSNAKPLTQEFLSHEPQDVRPSEVDQHADHHCCCCDHDDFYDSEPQESSGGFLGLALVFVFGFWFGGGFGDD